MTDVRKENKNPPMASKSPETMGDLKIITLLTESQVKKEMKLHKVCEGFSVSAN